MMQHQPQTPVVDTRGAGESHKIFPGECQASSSGITGEVHPENGHHHLDVESDGEDENMEICVVDDKPDPLLPPATAPRPSSSPPPSSPLSTGNAEGEINVVEERRSDELRDLKREEDEKNAAERLHESQRSATPNRPESRGAGSHISEDEDRKALWEPRLNHSTGSHGSHGSHVSHMSHGSHHGSHGSHQGSDVEEEQRSRHTATPPPMHRDHRERSIGHHRSPRTSPARSPSPLSPLEGESSTKKEPHSPPNVTVVHPQVSHPMFSYLYHPASMYSAASPSLSLPMSHMFFPGSPSSGMTLPFAPPVSLPDLSHLSGSAAAAGLSGASLSSMMLNGQLALAAGHHMWPSSYFNHHSAAGSLESPSSSSPTPPSLAPGGPGGSSHMGPLFVPRPTHRYSPYSLPGLTKTTMVTTSAPLPSTGLTSPHGPTDLRRPASSSPSSTHRVSPAGSHSPPPHPPPAAHSTPATVTSELKNIERMVNGLERQQEQLAAESLSKLEK